MKPPLPLHLILVLALPMNPALLSAEDSVDPDDLKKRAAHGEQAGAVLSRPAFVIDRP